MQAFVGDHSDLDVYRVALCRPQIYFLFLGDTVHTVFTVVYVYQTLINHFGESF